MQKITSGIALLAVLLFSACQKDLPSSTENKLAASLSNADVSGRNPRNDNGILFYALGEGNRLDLFNSDDADEMLNSTTITGLASGEKIIAIDFRPATGQLYGLGSTSRIYVINTQTGAARAIGTGPFTPALEGSVAGFDFNPTVDRIRIVTSTGQNLRINPETGAVAVIDGSINGVANAMVTSIAYANNVAGATTTTLYDIDVTTDKLYKQNPPNNGTLIEVGSLNMDLSGEGGFDIAPPNTNSNGSDEYTALAIYQANQKTALLSIDLMTGKAKKIEKFDRDLKYYGIAIPTLPVAYAVSGSNLLIFDPTNTSSVATRAITGIQAGEMLFGLDFRPVNGQLYAVGSNSRLYTLNASSGAATFVATLSVSLNGTAFGVDFNPVVDRIRIVSNTGQNLRVNPANGLTTVDASLNPGIPAVSAAAYANNFAGTTTTTLYVIDAANDKLYIQAPPNAGTLTEVGNLSVNIEANNGFDIGGTSNKGYGLFTSGGNTRIYSIDLNSGRANAGGTISGTASGFTIGLGF